MLKEIDIKSLKDNLKYFRDDLKITTNSRWISNFTDNPIYGNFKPPKRNFLPKPSSEFHGLWIAEIPFQMLIRFTHVGDTVWSIFGGSGVDYEVCKLLERDCIINDLNPKKDYILEGDTKTFNPGKTVDMILAHPPYWDIVKYSDNSDDGSNSKTLKEFVNWWQAIVDNVDKYLKKNGYFILACGNIYKNSEEIELGELLKNVLLKRDYILKQHIIKDYGETKGTELKNYNLNYYRQLRGRYGNFYGDNIYILRKQKSKNNIKEVLEIL